MTPKFSGVKQPFIMLMNLVGQEFGQSTAETARLTPQCLRPGILWKAVH